MKRTQKILFTTLSLLSLMLLTNGCAPKNSDGSYAQTYSYHPFNTQNNAQQTTQRPVAYNSHQRTYRPQYNPVPTQRTQVNPSSNLTKNIEHVAKSLLGTDYQYGANGPQQYDCSSFTKYVFSKQGINIPRVSRDQAKVGQFVKGNQLQKGDLIFFDSKKSSKVSHVGIYLGRGDFIHASSSKDKVTISNLNSNYYSSHFKWGRRVTNVNYAMR